MSSYNSYHGFCTKTNCVSAHQNCLTFRKLGANSLPLEFTFFSERTWCAGNQTERTWCAGNQTESQKHDQGHIHIPYSLPYTSLLCPLY